MSSARTPGRNLIDAGGDYVSVRPGGAFFDSAVSFALVRSGRLDFSLLGAFEVAANGDLANWIIPGRFSPGDGGAIERNNHCLKLGMSAKSRYFSRPVADKLTSFRSTAVNTVQSAL
ncbi:MAG: hypothetical protein HN725_07915 [Alphaproteobacteria bacterium]|nr:hypothetical protein [Alphaproteobacteria bacterium]MBT4082786.1 hypothetical protein [Alphaproteobacteria bacterium]MBT4544015.1 hypothetical protein [Alphaproteobacteria bacterium]MBT7745202.1 hypothetical protein [Alphaproteobacteria bacterium]